jgi:hypothetical protein
MKGGLMKSKFELGEILMDKITGFKGVAMGRTEYFTDCTHYGLSIVRCSQSLNKDGKVLDYEWFDETRLVRVKGAKKIEKELREPTSGPYPNAPSK